MSPPPPPPPETGSTFLLVDNDEVDVGKSDRRRFVAGTPPEDDEVEEEEEAAGIAELFVIDVEVVDLPPPLTMAPASFELDDESFISASCEDDVDEPLDRRSAAAPAEGDVVDDDAGISFISQLVSSAIFSSLVVEVVEEVTSSASQSSSPPSTTDDDKGGLATLAAGVESAVDGRVGEEWGRFLPAIRFPIGASDEEEEDR